MDLDIEVSISKSQGISKQLRYYKNKYQTEPQ